MISRRGLFTALAGLVAAPEAAVAKDEPLPSLLRADLMACRARAAARRIDEQATMALTLKKMRAAECFWMENGRVVHGPQAPYPLPCPYGTAVEAVYVAIPSASLT